MPSYPIISYIVTVVFIANYIFFFFLKRYAIAENPILKINYRIVSLLVTFSVLTIFSISSSVFDTYNKQREAPYNYNWLNLNDIIKFPFEALSIQNNEIKTPRINLFDSLELKDRNISLIILLDRTKSTNIKVDTNIVRIFQDKLRQDSTFAGGETIPDNKIEYITEFDDIRDLYCLEFLRDIYNSQIPNIDYQILYYMGDSNDNKNENSEGIRKSIFGGYNFVNKKEVKYCDAFDLCIQGIKEAKKYELDQHTTKITQMVNIIKKFSTKQKGNNIEKDNKENHVVVLSDFKDEANFLESHAELNSLNNTIGNLKLIGLKIGERNKEINLINKQLTRPLKSCIFENTIFNNNFNSNMYFGFDGIDSNNAIYFFYPFKDYFGRIYAKSQLDVNTAEGHSSVKIQLINNDNDIPENNNVNIEISGNPVYIDSSTILSINEINAKTIKCNSTSNYSNSLYLRFTETKTGSTKTYPIRILEMVPERSSIILIICYLVILALFAINSFVYVKYWYPLIFKKKKSSDIIPALKNVKLKSWYLIVFACIHSLIFLSLTYTFAYYLFWGWHTYFLFKLLLLSLLLLYFFFFYLCKPYVTHLRKNLVCINPPPLTTHEQ